MTDNDVTDDDRRKARLWAEKVDPAEVNPGYIGTPRDIYSAARVILATVPSPPATLADELRDICKKYSGDVEVDLEPLADRVEAVEKESERVETLKKQWAEVVSDLTDQTKLTSQYVTERDEAIAEVERLSRDLESQALLNKLKQGQVNASRAERDEFQNEMISSERKQVQLEAEVKRLASIIKNHPDSEFIFAPGGVIGERAKENLDRMNLPDPADVPEAEPYLVDVEGEDKRLLGLRNSGEPHPWETFSLTTLGSGGWCSDTDITLVARLVPDVRRVIDRPEDLDALPVGSIVITVTKATWKKTAVGKWSLAGGSCTSRNLIDAYYSVTVIHEPEEDE